MNTLACPPLDRQLAAIVERLQRLQHLNPADEAQRRQALSETHRVLGAVACYRHRLAQGTH